LSLAIKPSSTPSASASRPDPWLDDPTAAPPRPGRPLDLADGGRCTQLRLARQVVVDARLPWERLRPPPRLSPYRVRRGFPRLLCALGSPASAPKPAGRSPGRPKGSCRGPATRYPTVKSPPASPGRTRRRRPPPPRPPDRPTITTKRPPTSFDGPPACRRIKSQAERRDPKVSVGDYLSAALSSTGRRR
jgi:hypothetical protein